MKSMLALSLGLWWHAGIRTPSRTGFLFGFASVLLDFISLVEVTSNGFFFSDRHMHLCLPAGFVQKMNSLCKMYTYFFQKRHFGYFIFIFVQGCCSENESLKGF